MRTDQQRLKSKKTIFIPDSMVRETVNPGTDQAAMSPMALKSNLQGWESVPLKPEIEGDCFLECIGFLLESGTQGQYRNAVKNILEKKGALDKSTLEEIFACKEFTEEDLIQDVSIGLDRTIQVHVFQGDDMVITFKMIVEDTPTINVLHCNRDNNLDDDAELNFYRPLRPSEVDITRTRSDGVAIDMA